VVDGQAQHEAAALELGHLVDPIDRSPLAQNKT
jgi:hypothetical protein